MMLGKKKKREKKKNDVESTSAFTSCWDFFWPPFAWPHSQEKGEMIKEALRARVKRLKAECERLELEISGSQCEKLRENFKKKFQKAQHLLDKTSRELIEFQEQCLEIQTTALKKESAELKKESAELKKELAELKKELAELKKEFKEWKEEEKNLREFGDLQILKMQDQALVIKEMENTLKKAEQESQQEEYMMMLDDIYGDYCQRFFHYMTLSVGEEEHLPWLTWDVLANNLVNEEGDSPDSKWLQRWHKALEGVLKKNGYSIVEWDIATDFNGDQDNSFRRNITNKEKEEHLIILKKDEMLESLLKSTLTRFVSEEETWRW